MSDWSVVFLGVIAASTLVMAVIQVGILVAAARTARRATASIDKVEAALEPLAARLSVLAHESTALVGRVGATVDRAEHMLTSFESQVGRASSAVEAAVATGVKVPAREAAAWMAGARAAAREVKDHLPFRLRRNGSAPRVDVGNSWPRAYDEPADPLSEMD